MRSDNFCYISDKFSNITLLPKQRMTCHLKEMCEVMASMAGFGVMATQLQSCQKLWLGEAVEAEIIWSHSKSRHRNTMQECYDEIIESSKSD